MGKFMDKLKGKMRKDEHNGAPDPEPPARSSNAPAAMASNNAAFASNQAAPTQRSGTKSSTVYFDLTVNGGPPARVVFKLFSNVVPKTAENFRALCTGEYGYGYQGSTFHRMVPHFMLQGGDFTRGDGTGGKSIYGAKFNDENFQLMHDRPFLLSMANAGPNTNGSQFFITTLETPHLDGKHMVFGEVVQGKEFIQAIDDCISSPNEEENKPTVVIEQCGAL